MSSQPTQSSRVSGLNQSRKIITTQRSVTYQTINPASKSSQSLEPVSYVSPKAQPILPSGKNVSQLNLTPSSSQLYDSQTQIQQQQIGYGGSFQNRQPPSQQSLRNHDYQSFVSNPDNNKSYRRSEMHILTPKDISQNQSFTSATAFQINSTIPISQQGCIQTQSSLANGNQFIQQKQLNSIATYSSVPRTNQQPQHSQEVRVVKRQATGTFLSNTSNLEQSPPENTKNSQLSNYKSIQSLQPSQPIQINQVQQQNQVIYNGQKFHIPVEKAQQIQYSQSNQAIHTPLQSDRSVPASKPSLSNYDNKLLSQQNLQQAQQFQIQNQYNTGNQNKPSSRGESAPPNFNTYSAITSLASSVQHHQLSQNQNNMISSSHEGQMWNNSNNLNTSVFNVVVDDQYGIEEQIKRGRIESQQQNSVSKNYSPENKRGIQNSAYIDYSYKKSITDKVLAIQVQQSRPQYEEIAITDIWSKPPLPEKPKESVNLLAQFNQSAHQDIGHVASPQFGSIAIPSQYQEVQVSEPPIITEEAVQQTTSSENNNVEVKNNLFEQRPTETEESQESHVVEEVKPALQEINIQKIDNFINSQSIPQYESFQESKKRSNRSSTVDPIKEKREDPVTPSQFQILEELRNEQKVRESTPSNRILDELRQEQKVRESLFEERTKKSQIQDLNSKILVLDYSNTKETSGSGRSVSSDPYKGFSSFSQKYDGLNTQIPSYSSFKDQKLMGNDLIKTYLNAGVPSAMVSASFNQESKENINSFDIPKVNNENIKPQLVEEEQVKKSAKNQVNNTNDSIVRVDNATTSSEIPPTTQNVNNYTSTNSFMNEPIQVYTTQITSLNNPIVPTSTAATTATTTTTNTIQVSSLPSYVPLQPTNVNVSFPVQVNSEVNNQQNSYISPSNAQYNITNSQTSTVQNNVSSQPEADLAKLSTADYIKLKYAQLVADQRSKSEQPVISSYIEDIKKSPEITTTVTTFTTFKQPSPIKEYTTASQNVSSLPTYESYKSGVYNSTKTDYMSTIQQIPTTQTNSSEVYNTNKTDYTSTFQQVPAPQTNAVLASQLTSVSQPAFTATYERQNLHKEKLRSRQNSDEDVKRAAGKVSDNQTLQNQNSFGNNNANNNSSFGVQVTTLETARQENNNTIENGEEKKRLREVKSVDHLIVKRRFVDPSIEEEVKGWVNPIFEEFIKNNFKGKYNEQEIQEAIRRSKSEIGFITNNGKVSPVVIEEQLLQLIEQQKKLIDQQNVQIQLQNEVQKSQLYGNSQISSPHMYPNQTADNILLQNQLNNSHTKSHSQLLGGLSSDNHLQYQSNINLQNLSQYNYASNHPQANNLKTTPQSSQPNYYSSNVQGNPNVSTLSQNSSAGNQFSQYPNKIAHPSNPASISGQDMKFYMNTSNIGSTNADNHHRIVSYFDQVVEQQHQPDNIDYNLTISGVHEDFNSINVKNANQVLISPISNSIYTYDQKSVSPAQPFASTTSPSQPIGQQFNQTCTPYQATQITKQTSKEIYSDKSLLENLNTISQNALQQQSQSSVNPLSQINSLLHQNSNQLYASSQLAQSKKDTSHIELNNIQPHDDEMLLEDLTPFNNYRQKNERVETEVRAENSNNKVNEDEQEDILSPNKQEQFQSTNKNQYESNSSQGAGTGRGNGTDRQNSKIQHSQSMRTDQGCEEIEDDYDQVPKYFSENNSVRDNRESNYSVNQNKQSKFQQNKTEPSYTSSSPGDLSDREEMHETDDVHVIEKQVKKSAKKANKRVINMSNDARITEESQSNLNDGSQLASMNVNLYKGIQQQQADNVVVGEYTPVKNQLNDSESFSQSQQNSANVTPNQKQAIREEMTQSPSQKEQSPSSEVKQNDQSSEQYTPSHAEDTKIADLLIESNNQSEEQRSSENNKVRISQQESIPLEQVDEDDLEYHREGNATNSTKKIVRQNKSDVQTTQSGSKRANIPKSSSSLTIQKDSISNRSSTNDLVKKQQELRKSETSDSKKDLMANEQIRKNRQSMDKKRKESRESSDSGTYVVFQDIKMHVQEKIKHYDSKKTKQQKSDAILEDINAINDSANIEDSARKQHVDRSLKQSTDLQKSPQNIMNILSNKASTLKKRFEKQSPKDSSKSHQFRSPKKSDTTQNLKISINKSQFNKEEQLSSQREQKNILDKKKSEILKVSVKSPTTTLSSSSKSPEDREGKNKPRVPHLDKPSSFNISQSTVRSANQSQVQSPQSETLKSTVRKLQGHEEITLKNKIKQSKQKGKESEQKVFILHKNMTFDYNQHNNEKTLSRFNTDQAADSKQSKVKIQIESDRKSSPSYKATQSTQVTTERNKISISPSPLNDEQIKKIQKVKQQSPTASNFQITITGKNVSKEQMNSSVQSNKRFISSTSLNEDPNTLNLYQRYQEKKLQERELVQSQTFQRKKSTASNANNNMNLNTSNNSHHHLQQEQEEQQQQQQQYQHQQSLKSPENIYQQNQNLRYQQQQYLSNQTKQNNQQQEQQQQLEQQQQQQQVQQQQKQSQQQAQNIQNSQANSYKAQNELQAYKQKQREQLEKIQSKLEQEEEEYQILINSQSQPTVDATIAKSGKHLSPTQSERSAVQHLNKLFMNSPQTTNKNQVTNISQQQMNSQGSLTNNLYTQEGTYTQDYEEYLYQEYIRDQRDKLIQQNIQEGVNSGQLTNDQQIYIQELDKQENRHKFKEFIKRNLEWVQEKERKISEQQLQKMNMEMSECTFKPLINSQNTLDVNKPVFVPSTKSSRLLEEQTKMKINSQQNSMNHVSSSKSFRKSNQASRVGSNAQIGEMESRSHLNASRKFSNHSKLQQSPPMQPQFNTPPSYAHITQQYAYEKQGSNDLKKDINDVLGILQNLSQPQL